MNHWIKQYRTKNVVISFSLLGKFNAEVEQIWQKKGILFVVSKDKSMWDFINERFQWITPERYKQEPPYSVWVDVSKNGEWIENHRLDNVRIYITLTSINYDGLKSEMSFKCEETINSKFILKKGI